MGEQEERASAMRRHPSYQSRLRAQPQPQEAEPEQGQHDDEMYEAGRAVAISRAHDYRITYPVGHPLHGFVDYDIDAALDDQYNEQETTS